MVRVKVCGLTNELDAGRAAKFGACALGFIFYKKSPRFVSPFKARKIIETLPPFVTTVGVFVNQPFGAVKDIIEHCGLGIVQLHGDEDPHFCQRIRRSKTKVIKVVRVDDSINISALKEYQGKVDAFLFDTADDKVNGGTGRTFNWKLLSDVKSLNIPIILSGGLNAQNVIEPVNELKPYAVDVNSTIEETPGKKDPKKMKEFIDVVTYISGPNVKES